MLLRLFRACKPRDLEIGGTWTVLRVHPSTVLLFGGIIASGIKFELPLWMTAGFTANLVVAILIHEFGHAARLHDACGGECEIFMHALGGHMKGDGLDNLKDMDRIYVSFWGPLMNLIIAIVALLLLLLFRMTEVAFVLVLQAFILNAFLGISNLIPIMPLDGGWIAWSLMRVILPRRAWRFFHEVFVGTSFLISLEIIVAGVLLLEPLTVVTGLMMAINNAVVFLHPEDG